MAKKDTHVIALERAIDILEAWWFENVGEDQFNLELTDEEMAEVLDTPIKVVGARE